MNDDSSKPKISPCEICKTTSNYCWNGALMRRQCPRCGGFEYDSNVGLEGPKTEDHMIRLSGWVRDQNDAGVEFVTINQEILERSRTTAVPSLHERSLRVLKIFSRKNPSLVRPSDIDELCRKPEFLGRSYSKGPEDLEILFAVLVELGLIKAHSTIRAATITIRGLLQIESMDSKNLGFVQGFVAMSFDEALQDAWTFGFYPAIRSTNFHPLRIDNKEFLGGISDEIISEIRRSRFLIADYTGQKHGVYFEAGFALGIGIPVIPTCREEDVNKLHFDIKHLNTLVWKNYEDLASKLEKRIRAVIPI